MSKLDSPESRERRQSVSEVAVERMIAFAALLAAEERHARPEAQVARERLRSLGVLVAFRKRGGA